MDFDRREALKQFIDKAEYMESRINSGVRENRMGKRKVRFTSVGKPLLGVNVSVKQKSHDFLYGANIFMLDEFENEEKNSAYRKYFKETFNQATLPFYWSTLEPEKGKPRYEIGSTPIYRRPAIELCMDFCEKNNITPKEHCLFYDPYMPSWVKNDTDSVKSALSAHFAELAKRYSGRIKTWEVINETLTRYYRKGNTVFYDDKDVIEWCFKEAEKYFPNNELVINEAHPFVWEYFHGRRSNYYLQIERALNKGARIDSIGLQYHMFHTVDRYNELSRIYYDPERIYDVLDVYSDFGKPIQITEVTIPAYSDSKYDEDIQSEIIKNVYKMWFSHKNVEAITYWNLVDGYAAFAKQGDMKSGENIYYGGLIDYNLRPKPAYNTIKELFEKEYRTYVNCVTDKNGEIEFDGFYGSYDIEFTYDGKTYCIDYHLSKEREESTDVEI